MADYVGGRPTNRIQGLDALRTLAIVGVTLFHIFPDVVKGGAVAHKSCATAFFMHKKASTLAKGQRLV